MCIVGLNSIGLWPYLLTHTNTHTLFLYSFLSTLFSIIYETIAYYKNANNTNRKKKYNTTIITMMATTTTTISAALPVKRRKIIISSEKYIKFTS